MADLLTKEEMVSYYILFYGNCVQYYTNEEPTLLVHCLY